LDEVRMLEQDHHEIEVLFDQYDCAGEDERAGLIERARYEIETHTRASQEIFYPAVRAAMGRESQLGLLGERSSSRNISSSPDYSPVMRPTRNRGSEQLSVPLLGCDAGCRKEQFRQVRLLRTPVNNPG